MGRSTSLIPAVPAAWSVTTIAFIVHLLVWGMSWSVTTSHPQCPLWVAGRGRIGARPGLAQFVRICESFSAEASVTIIYLYISRRLDSARQAEPSALVPG